MKSMLNTNTKIDIAGKLPAGQYTIVLSDIICEENVAAISGDRVPKDLMKAIRGKEKATLDPELIREVEALDMGPDFFFQDGSPKPRWQNRTVFKFVDKVSGKKLSCSFFGGPAISTGDKGLAAFIMNATGINPLEKVGGLWDDLFKPGDEFTAAVKENGNFTNLDTTTIRKVGLPPLPQKEGTDNGSVNVGEFSKMASILLQYLEGPGKGISPSEIGQIHTKGITIEGVALNDFGPIAHAWAEIKAKTASYLDDTGKILIVRK